MKTVIEKHPLKYSFMNLREYQEILNISGFADVMTDDSYNEDYAHNINLTVQDLRRIYLTIQDMDKLRGRK
jgi:hypothetical protein